MRFEPVFLERALERRVSQTMLRHTNACPRSGFLYAANKGEAQTVEMVRGSALHAVCERATLAMLEQGEPTIPPEIVKAIVGEVLAEYPLAIEEHDYLRECAYRWASEWTIDPSAVVACEALISLDIDGWAVRSKIDFAELRGSQLYIADYKSGRGAPAYDEVSRKRPDGTLSAKNFQLILYALSLVFGRPVRVDGEVETPEPFPLAPHAQGVIAEFVYPGIEDSEGHMLRREVTLTRTELAEYRESLGALVGRVERAEQNGDWPAVVSDSACGECPCPSRCPIPAELRDHRGTINDREQASEALEVLDRRKKIDSATRREVREWARHNGEEVIFGHKAARFVVRESDKIDKVGLRAAVERAVKYGEDFEWGDYVKRSTSTNFVDVALTEEEL